jgi:hypothetical protein
MRPGTVRIRCPEISLQADGAHITAYVRNDEGPSYVFNSDDYAENWQPPRINPMRIGNSKIFAGELSDGRKYIIYNEERGYFVRTMLVMAVADAGSPCYNRVYKLFNNDEPQIGRGKTWFYPCAYESDGTLYIACTLQEPTNIRSAVMAKVPVASL